MKSRRSAPFRKKASSLVTTLLVLVVLSTIVVAFMQSMSVERLTSKNYADHYRAVLVSDAAVKLATASLSATTNSGPYSTAFYVDPGTTVPYLFQTKLALANSQMVLTRLPQFSSRQDIALFSNTAVPVVLTSGFSLSDKDDKGNAITRSVAKTADISFNINSTNKVFTMGQIGLASSGTVPQVIPVNWTYFYDNNGQVVGRYGYWVDDESSKIDVRYAGNTNGAAGAFLRGNGTNVNEISVNALTNYGLDPTLLTNLATFKAISNHFGVAETRYGPNSNSTNISDGTWQKLRPFLTMYSLQDDRAPDGKRKLNLNEIVSTSTDPTIIGQQVAKIKDAIVANIPNFGNRYFQANAVDADSQTTYVNKIAANIRDFIDTDRNATVILSDGSVTTTNAPNFIPYNTLTSDLPVFGKEDVPFLNEYVRVMRVTTPDPASTVSSTTSLTITARAAHYVELWNMSPKTVAYSDLGPNPFVCIANRTSWINNFPGGSPTTLRPIDIRIYLPSNFSIPPGGFAVLTTDSAPFGNQAALLGSTINRYQIGRLPGDTANLDPPVAGTWQAVDAGGQTNPTDPSNEDYQIVTGLDKSDSTKKRYNIQCFGSTTGAYQDCRERIIFGNDNGLFDCALRVYTIVNAQLAYGANNPLVACTYPGDGQSSVANNAPTTSSPRYSRGDPRSNMEVIAMSGNTGDTWKNATTAYWDSVSSVQMTLGAMNFNVDANSTPLRNSGWSEYTADSGISENHLVPNAQLYSLGQLGSLYDPARYDTNGGYRGSGRTLRIGQSDDLANNRNNNSTVATDQQWLGGLGSTNVMATNSAVNASKLLEVFRTDNTNSGRINPNGIGRASNNPAIYALVDGFTFATNIVDGASATLSNKTLLSTNLVAAMYTNVTLGTPFLGAGDISRLSIFNTSTNLAGVNIAGTPVAASTSDSGREEFFRRTANLMATESLAFTITSKAQAGKFRKNALGADVFVPSATVTRETTFQLIPSYPTGQDRPVPSSWQTRTVRDILY